MKGDPGVVRHRWRTHLKNATSEGAVLELVRTYLAEWPSDEVASLPLNAWPANIRSRGDIMSWMFRIGDAHSKFKGDPAVLVRLQELLLFLTHAAVRVTQIGAGMSDAPAVNDAAAAPEAQRSTANGIEKNGHAKKDKPVTDEES
jgi:hypothetical protein